MEPMEDDEILMIDINDLFGGKMSIEKIEPAEDEDKEEEE